MYILSISKKAFVRFEENGDIIIVSKPEKATKYEILNIAIEAAKEINKEFEEDVTKIIITRSFL